MRWASRSLGALSCAVFSALVSLCDFRRICFCCAGVPYQCRRIQILKSRLVGECFHTIGIVGIGIFLNGARGQGANILGFLQQLDLRRGLNCFPSLRVYIGSTRLLIDDFASLPVNASTALTLGNIDGLLAPGKQGWRHHLSLCRFRGQCNPATAYEGWGCRFQSPNACSRVCALPHR